MSLWQTRGDSETVSEAAQRELFEETNVDIDSLSFFSYFDEVMRDPRERTISFAFLATLNRYSLEIKAADDASEVMWYPIKSLPKLSFDHMKIIDTAIKKLDDIE
ncbi:MULTISPECIES: NUDIX domain-containing protein [unclassified Pseudoalteromonas]|uniref:NUDIX domain-containing protein n=1 Tax=unclassified Pseudoalteromonas TaxID=194690 RepID=UPI0025B4BD79|nr:MULTISPECIES: NUDIX domain-containing protein [unclassified Pseudoalteromonas]MDN3431469.1 NUDIX domain-containing protein [Pseudoalteromonas sp. APC 3907]MDN3463831.1 NUDIX domain-containing protein [Pseudoalteromonas sp. APC 3495]